MSKTNKKHLGSIRSLGIFLGSWRAVNRSWAQCGYNGPNVQFALIYQDISQKYSRVG